MGKITGGTGLYYSGTIDGFTYSKQKDGSVHVKKKNGPSKVAPTDKQLAERQKTRIINEFMKPLKEFVKIGYALEGESTGCNGYNAMVRCLRTDALAGAHPFQHIDFSKVLITKGDMEPPMDVAAVPADSGVTFSWNPEMKLRGSHYSDQVIMLAYFPELRKVRFIAAGAQRYRGQDTLELNGITRGHLAELFIAFIADNRSNISDSVYVGQLNW